MVLYIAKRTFGTDDSTDRRSRCRDRRRDLQGIIGRSVEEWRLATNHRRTYGRVDCSTNKLPSTIQITLIIRLDLESGFAPCSGRFDLGMGLCLNIPQNLRQCLFLASKSGGPTQIDLGKGECVRISVHAGLRRRSLVPLVGTSPSGENGPRTSWLDRNAGWSQRRKSRGRVGIQRFLLLTF